MYEFPWIWAVFGILFWVLLVRPRRLRACHARWSADGVGGPLDEHPGRRQRGRRADLEGGLAERDALIAKLEERVRVLERIATDYSARLRAEIESLR